MYTAIELMYSRVSENRHSTIHRLRRPYASNCLLAMFLNKLSTASISPELISKVGKNPERFSPHVYCTLRTAQGKIISNPRNSIQCVINEPQIIARGKGGGQKSRVKIRVKPLTRNSHSCVGLFNCWPSAIN